MATAHANQDDLRRLQRSVRQTEEAIDQALQGLQRTLDRADWNDAARRSFEDKLKEASASVNQAKQRLAELEPILTRKIAELATYLRR